MNIKIKLIAAAAALVAAGAANANIIGAAGGDSEFVFSAYANGVGYTFDTGIKLTDVIGTQFNSGAAVSNPVVGSVGFDLVLPDFASFLTQTGVASNQVQWNLIGADNSGTRRIVQTVAELPTAMMHDKQVLDSVGAFDVYAAANNGLGTHGTTANGYSITTTNDGAAYAGLFGANFGGNSSFLSNAGLDAAMDLLVVRSKFPSANTNNFGAFGSLVDASGQQLQASAYLDNAGAFHLQVAAVPAVPEPETYAMLLAGLGLVGAIARRRAK